MLMQNNEDGEDERRSSGEEEGIRSWMGWERGWKKATDSRRHQYRAPPPLLGVCHLVQRGRVEKHKREGTPPLSKPLVKTEVMTEPYEDVKNFGWQPHTHTHTCKKSLVAQSEVTTEVDEDVKSLTAAIRLGGSETREGRQQRDCEMWTAEEVEWKRSLLLFVSPSLSLCWPPFSLSSESPQFCSVAGRVGMLLCASVFACVFPPSGEISWLCFFPTHLQCLVNSRKQLDRKRQRERRQHWKRDDRKSKRMIEWVRNRCIQSL